MGTIVDNIKTSDVRFFRSDQYSHTGIGAILVLKMTALHWQGGQTVDL